MLDPHGDTSAVHAGKLTLPSNAPSSPPLFAASSYAFEDLADVEAIYSGERAGMIYGRYGGPNGIAFEAAVAELEGAEAAAGAAAGMSAIDAALAPALRAGDCIVATREIYGGTFALFESEYRPRGIAVNYVDQGDLVAVAGALEQFSPKALYVEALTNPLVHVADLPALAALAATPGRCASSTRPLPRPCSCVHSRSASTSWFTVSASISAATATSVPACSRGMPASSSAPARI